MILVYEFEYVSNNNVLENFLQNFADESKIEYYITKDGCKISLHVRGDEDILIAFSDKLSNSLPFSIFLKSTSVNVANEWDNDKAIVVQKCEIYIPFTKKALNAAKDEFNPFVKNEIGRNLDIYPPLVFTCNDKSTEYKNSFKDAFSKAVDVIANGEKINFKTLNGTFCVSMIKKEAIYKDDILIMPSDLSFVDKIAVLEDEEVAILASLEKPTIKAHTNLVFSSQYPNFPRFIKLKLASDLFLYFLSLALFKKGVKFVVLEAKDDRVNTSLYFKQEIRDIEQIEVCALKSGQNIITKGTSFTTPNLLKNIKTLKKRHHMQFAATIQELELFEKTNCGIYLSLNNDDMIMLYNDKDGVLDFIQVDFEDCLSQILENIEKDDDNGRKLIEKYKQNFPQIYENAKNISFKNKNISTLWAAAAYLLGFGDNLSDAQRKLFENIEIFGGQKGPRIDYKLTDENSVKTSLNERKFLRSVMSFKLAGTDDEILSFGIAESLVYFLSDFADKVKDDFEVENILLMGSLFGSKTISNLCVKHIGVNHKVHFNKELPIEL
ncbi:MAG: hypothetical protein LBJ88_03075 [Campylobacteraceae bacterium]|jgi:hypothetical protein|nr:hypothetical protein [Campylobacteraceae bacterium]